MRIASILNKDVGATGKWIAGAGVLAFITFLLVAAGRHSEGLFGPPNTRLESVLWTSTADCQTFYGPGTPQSQALAHKLYAGNYLEASFRVPNVPIYLAPLESFRIPNHHPILIAFKKTDWVDRDTPNLIYNFSPEMAAMLRKAHSPAHPAEDASKPGL
jgi:hypothetical protein